MSARKRLITLFTALGIVLSGVFAVSASASAAGPIPDGYYYVHNSNSGKCLAIGGASKDDGAKAIQWACMGIPDQRWYLRHMGSGLYAFINQNSGKCLAIGGSSTGEGAHAIQWTCLAITDQRWFASVTSTGWEFVNQGSGKALAIAGASKDDGAQAIQWTRLGTPEQRWF
ncbi:hypothetical protein ALI144C_40510 [Actinosynnema sp. ALI-1.44]|uniref:RICIN domain-containing protein n=1 Tax=Actinosynnema sp. ALI-1.44 TaxID=1933779 RepID=UPI00097C7B24|nr:RICIN domain-containing protein [Actinosynnema sp. ALI-1.44]ONI75051.1 hypothetical protein ALI144C_40510 [Actinosynnema sp. ALI-1.44]